MPPRLSIPPVTRIVLAVFVLESLVAIWHSQGARGFYLEWLVLVPQLSLFYPWTFLTSTLAENNILTFVITALAIFQGGRYLERAWSSREFTKFLLVVSAIPNFLSFLLFIALFTLTRNESWTLTTVGGAVPLQISFLVAFSQLVPAHTVTLFRGVLSLRVPKFPLIYIGLVTALQLTPFASSASLPLALFGFITSWTYLRFYKTVFPDLDTSQPTSMRGDASETFAFSEFFPAPVKPFVAAFSEQIFSVLVAMHVCTPFSQADVSAAQSNNFIPRSAPGGVRAEAERRRALALKVLDQRLQTATTGGPGSRSQSTPPVQTSGPTIQTQPQPNAQTAMTSQPEAMLGETHYDPDHDSGEKTET
ncbi:eukaryotic integral membrane protein-domain-containing protein [Xylariaceae sp. FL1272]|nr:eukaryotic integral membrane protein-domain-containing protein [Xylariaceae sp. FL1272]